MRTLQEFVDTADDHTKIFLLHFLDIDADSKENIIRWCDQQGLVLEHLDTNKGELHRVDFCDLQDPRLKHWMDSWENRDGSSKKPDAYRLIVLSIQDLNGQ